MHKLRFLWVLLAFVQRPLRADRIAYQGHHTVEVRSADLIAKHEHTWDARTTRLFNAGGDFFGPENDFSFLTVVDAKSGKRLFRAPVPALTRLLIDERSRYVVGLSTIKLHNPFQLVVFDRTGKLLLKRRVRQDSECLDAEVLKALRATAPASEILTPMMEARLKAESAAEVSSPAKSERPYGLPAPRVAAVIDPPVRAAAPANSQPPVGLCGFPESVSNVVNWLCGPPGENCTVSMEAIEDDRGTPIGILIRTGNGDRLLFEFPVSQPAAD